MSIASSRCLVSLATTGKCCLRGDRPSPQADTPGLGAAKPNRGTLLYMPVREAPDRRGRPLRGRAGLLERDFAASRRSPLSWMRSRRASATRSCSRATRAWARPGCTRRRSTKPADAASASCGRPARSSSRTSRFGVAGQLVRALLQRPTGRRRAGLSWPTAPERVRSLAGPRGDLSEPGDGRRPDRVARTVHRDGRRRRDASRLCWPSTICTGRTPHRSSSSLYVLHRLDELPVALVMTRRPRYGRRALRGAGPHREPLPGPGRDPGAAGARGGRSGSRARCWATAPSRRWSRRAPRSPPATRSTSASCWWRWARTVTRRPPSSRGGRARWPPTR